MPPLFLTKLDAIRLRLRRRAIVKAIVSALCVGLATTFATLVLRTFVPGVTAPAWAAGLGAALVAGLILLAIATRPSIADAARLLDQETLSRELYSAAQFVHARSANGVIASAVKETADARISAIVPEQIVRFDWRRASVALGSLTLLVGLASAFMPGVHQASSVADDDFSAELFLGEGERVSLAADVQRLAAFLQKQAENQNDEFAQAIGRTLEEIGTRLAGDDEVLREDLAAELADLRDYTAQATSDWEMSAAPRLLDALADQVMEPNAERTRETAAGTAHPSTADTSAAEQGTQQSRFDQMMAEAEAGVEPPPDLAELVQEADNGHEYDYDDAMTASLTSEFDPDAPPSAGVGQPTAAAEEGGGGASQMAGDGTTEIAPAAAAFMELEFEVAEDMVLENIDLGDGARVEEEIVRPSQLSVVVSPTDASISAAWTRHSEAPVSRTAILPADQESVSQYRLLLRDGGAQ
jgi:TRAP-type mannitol/chloroaromatic compound transport system, large permease component